VADAFPWYESVEGEELQQGDLLNDCPAPVHHTATEPSAEPLEVPVWNVIVMTQSCDLGSKRALPRVMVCPVWDVAQFLETFKPDERKDRAKSSP
jgi:hypothetical protein